MATKMLIRLLLVSGIPFIVTGCASTLPPPDNIRLTSQIANPENCRYVGDVRGDENVYGGWAFNDLSQKSAEAKLMQSAAKIGANTVLVEKSTSGFVGSNMSGKAYVCN